MSFCYISITLKSIYVYYSCFYASIDRNRLMETARLFFSLFHVQSQRATALGTRIKSRETKTEQYYCIGA
jgi:hypothetical protein